MDTLESYAEAHSSPEDALLQRINRETHLYVMHPRMLSGHLQGALLKMIACMLRPQRILEIGTYTGYSAICLSQGLAEVGELITIEHDPELEERASGYFKEAGLQNRIKMIIGEAGDIIPSLSGSFDLVFIDADKRDYPALYSLAMEKVQVGGFILADNVLWAGKVLNEPASNDYDTRGIQEFNQLVLNDKRAENLLLPFHDGLMMIRKLS
jgi:predicted O-methyltransferase YrrM